VSFRPNVQFVDGVKAVYYGLRDPVVYLPHVLSKTPRQAFRH
jgi:hypothetical protein